MAYLGRGTAGHGAQMTATRETNLDTETTSLQVPALVVVAGQDRIVLPSSTRLLGQAIPAAKTVELPDAGHGLVVDDAVELAPLISDFLALDCP